MKRLFNALLAFFAVAVLTVSSLSFAQQADKPPMHMHKSEMNHDKSDPAVAAEYKDEASQLREKATSHRELAKQYRARGPGKANYDQIAKHCDNLAKFYEDAAKEADAVSAALVAK